MISDFANFADLGIPMVKELNRAKKNTSKEGKPALNEKVFAYYDGLLKGEKSFQLKPMFVGADGSLRRIEGGYEIVLPSDQVFERDVLTPERAAKQLTKVFTCVVESIVDGVITVSHTKAMYGNGTLKERAIGRIRAITGESLRKMKPHIPGLRKAAEEWANEYVESRKKAGKTYTEDAKKTLTIRRYYELYEQKKEAEGVARCIVPATVEDVHASRIILNLFNLDIMGTCSRANWNGSWRELDLREHVRTGDVIEVEVLSYDTEANLGNSKIPGAWICSRKTISKKMDALSFQQSAAPYPVGSTVQVICDKEGYGTTRRWLGHIRGTNVPVSVKYGPRAIGVNAGMTYIVRINEVSEERQLIEGKTLGYASKSGGIYIPKKDKKQGEETSKKNAAPDFFDEEPLADTFSEVLADGAVATEPKEPGVQPIVEKSNDGEAMQVEKPGEGEPEIQVEGIASVPPVKTDW